MKNLNLKSIFLMALLIVIAGSCASTHKAVSNGGLDYYNLQPDQGKALVYIARPATVGFLIPMNIQCDGKTMGTNMGKNFLYFMTEPGDHTIVSYAENNDELRLQTEPGKVYYVLQKVKMGIVMARCKLELMDEKTGKSKLNKCNLSKRMIN